MKIQSIFTARQLKELKEVFVKEKVTLAYVFGSQATGHKNSESDLDIAILLPKKLSTQKRFNLRLKLTEKISEIAPFQVDLIILNDIKSVFFKFIIIKEGILLYRQSEKYQLEFESKLMNEYFDFQPFLELQNKHYVENCL